MPTNNMTLTRKNAEARTNQAKLFDSISNNRPGPLINKTNTRTSLHNRQQPPRAGKLENNRKNMKS
jgi:hypothetical protein